MTDNWYILRDGHRHGPYTAAQMKNHAATGHLLPVDLVTKDGMSEPVPAGRVKGLFPTAPTQAASVPSGSPTDEPPPVPRHRLSSHNRVILAGTAVAAAALLVVVAVAVSLSGGTSGTAKPGDPPVVAGGSPDRQMKERTVNERTMKERTPKGRSTPGSGGSWAEKAFSLSGEKKDPSFKPADAGSLQDFFDAVNVLSVRIGDVPIRSGAKIPCNFAAPGCDAEVWHGVFGEPEPLSRGRERIGRVENEFDRWRVRCTDGSVTVHGKVQRLEDKTYYYPTMLLVD